MRQSDRKYLFCCVLAILLGAFVLLSATGCSDNPEDQKTKAMRQQTAEAVKLAVSEKDLAGSQSKIQNALSRNRTSGLAQDSALLVSGNLALMRGQQMQAEMSLKALPLRASVDAFERLLRRTESLLVENEHMTDLLSRGDQEIAELQQLLTDGVAGAPGLNDQLADANAQLKQLSAQQAAVQDQKQAAQTVLDDSQNQADQLMRKAEQASGDQKLELQNQSFDILKKRKGYYIDVQAAENQLNVLEKKIQLQQLAVTNLTQSVADAKGRIDEIENSDTRALLKQQMADINQVIARNQKNLTSLASEISQGLKEYKDYYLGQGLEKTSALGFFETAIDEFKKIRSGDADFVAKCRLGESYYYAARVCSGYVNVARNLSLRLKDLADFTEPAFAQSLSAQLPIEVKIDSALQEQTLAYYDLAMEAYDQAFSRAGRIGSDAKCSVLKSQLLTAHTKMEFAEIIGNVTGNYDLATETEAKVDELKVAGTELGVCFTQSEAFKVVTQGIDYVPTLPMNMDVLADGLKVKFTDWKRKPLTEQEAEIDQNLIEIDELIAKYGQELADQLTPLKQEMQAAKERGFEPTANTTGSGDPNSF